MLSPLLLTALLAGVLASIVSGIIGSYVVVKRIVFISGSISHCVLGGIGFALWLEKTQGFSWPTPMAGALLTAIFAALLMGWIQMHYKQREDSVIATLWSIGMAAGILFISQTPGYTVELSNYLIGNILWVSPDDLYTLTLLDALVIGTVLLFHKRFLAICFDEQQARLQGLSTKTLYLLLLVLTAISIVLLIQVVGIILVLALLTLPPSIANLYTSRLSHMMVIAILLSIAFSLLGTLGAYWLDWPIGPTIVLLAGLTYTLALLTPKGWIYIGVRPDIRTFDDTNN